MILGPPKFPASPNEMEFKALFPSEDRLLGRSNDWSPFVESQASVFDSVALKGPSMFTTTRKWDSYCAARQKSRRRRALTSASRCDCCCDFLGDFCASCCARRLERVKGIEPSSRLIWLMFLQRQRSKTKTNNAHRNAHLTPRKRVVPSYVELTWLANKTRHFSFVPRPVAVRFRPSPAIPPASEAISGRFGLWNKKERPVGS